VAKAGSIQRVTSSRIGAIPSLETPGIARFPQIGKIGELDSSYQR